MLKYSNSNNQIIAQKIAELTINNYEKGLAIKNQEEGQPDDIDDNNVNTIVPTTDVSIKSKSGYSVKDKNKNKVISSAGKSLIDSFISQSDILDNELLQLMTMTKVSNTKEIYGGSENDAEPTIPPADTAMSPSVNSNNQSQEDKSAYNTLINRLESTQTIFHAYIISKSSYLSDIVCCDV